MSFKREANDGSSLNSLRHPPSRPHFKYTREAGKGKRNDSDERTALVTCFQSNCGQRCVQQRRIRDLLAVNIPEDEATLLSNGRFACVVCHHKPVFDTVDMLAVHRSGKRHEASLQHHEEKKAELQELIRKRRHEAFVKTGSSDIKIASTHFKCIGSIAPYDPRVKKKVKPYDRKPKLSLSSTPKATQSRALPGNRAIEAIQSQGLLKHPKQLKKIFESPDSEFVLRPYQRKSEMLGDNQNLVNEAKTDSESGWNSGQNGHLVTHAGRMEGERSAAPPPPPPEPGGSSTDSTVTKEDKDRETVPSEKKELAEKYWQMAGSGWRKDWDGKWIRDDDCEFDSDEEPPDLP